MTVTVTEQKTSVSISGADINLTITESKNSLSISTDGQPSALTVENQEIKLNISPEIRLTVQDQATRLLTDFGAPGAPGQDGQGVPAGGTTGQALVKNSNDDFDTEWVDMPPPAWGNISGILADQTDLQAALDAKAAAIHQHLAVDITDFASAADARITAQKGVALGLGTLDATGKQPIGEVNPAVLGAANYQGTWNASTNSPVLASSAGTKGHYYVVDTAGSTNINGITDWKLGDWIIFNGSVWQKVDNTDAVISVNGFTGSVVLGTANVVTANSITNSMLRASTALSIIGRASNTTGAVADIVASLDGGVLRRSGTALGFGAINLASANAVSGLLPFANIANGAALSLFGRASNSAGVMAAIAAGTDHQVMRRSGTTIGFGAINLAQAAAVTGILPMANMTIAGAAQQVIFNDGSAYAGSATFLWDGSFLYVPSLYASASLQAQVNTSGTRLYASGTIKDYWQTTQDI